MLLIILIVSSSTCVPITNLEHDGATDYEELLDEEKSQFQKQPSFFIESIGRMVRSAHLRRPYCISSVCHFWIP